jgi:predicted RNA-binding Zn ribbon-like protein
MAGETQPGGRRPAPGDLAIVQAFINSHFDLEVEHGADLLSSPAELGRWLSRHGLRRSARGLSLADLAVMLELRVVLREVAAGHSDAAALNRFASGAPVELRFEGAGAGFTLATGHAVTGSIGLLLGITAHAMFDGTWSRLKVCPGEDCGWAFYDHSRNQTGRWCSMSVCGGRAKARTHYRRRRARR